MEKLTLILMSSPPTRYARFTRSNSLERGGRTPITGQVVQKGCGFVPGYVLCAADHASTYLVSVAPCYQPIVTRTAEFW